MNNNIIIIDPQNEIGNKLKNTLIDYNFITEKVFNLSNAYRLIKKNKSNFCLLCSYDTFIEASKTINMLKKNGYKIQIILICTTYNKIDIIKAYQFGIDDYSMMPLDYDILKCKINCIFKTSSKVILRQNRYDFGKFFFNTKERILLFDNSITYSLSPIESLLLELLLINKCDLLTREQALHQIWYESSTFTSKCMDVYITKLRKILQSDPTIKISNIYKSGYSLFVP